MTRAVSIGLKIPDNAAYTALVALRRMRVPVEHVERSEIWLFDDDGDGAALGDRVRADETIFNPNKHRLVLLESAAPRPGEVWIEPLEPGGRCKAIAWRLWEGERVPASHYVLAAAVERLLCNPAIEKAVY
ncbi:MAG: hypothetical protein WA814_06180 [Candidatus Baltobacteraceae bacterium]